MSGQNKSTQTREARLEFIGLAPEHGEALEVLWPSLEGELAPLLDRFYEHLLKYEELKPLLGGLDKVAALKAAQASHWERLFKGDFGVDYFERAVTIGNAHQRINLEPRWYVSAYAIVLGDLLAIVRKATKRKSVDLTVEAVTKAVMLDMELAVSVYIEAGDRVLQERLSSLADGLDKDVAGAVETVVGQVDDIDTASGELGHAATKIEGASSSVASASEEASASIGTVAAASEELATSVQEVGRQMSETHQAVQRVTDEASHIGEAMSGLSTEVQQIGKIVDLIRDVADQTNLLALNATIEAARAGEAGKGFAVVASEVKALASQTGKATQEISDQVTRVQQQTAGASEGITRITNVISQLEEIAQQVESAIGEQGAATNEIAGSVQQTATGTKEVSGSIANVAAEITAMSAMATRLQEVSSGLRGATTQLRDRVQTTVEDLRQGDQETRQAS
ncbi:globin-coupled sensor protein [Pyruvatibacter sp. HU-CL02332]|uniref:globin-coupled sensor protein n=1 Tax=Pyruvatibacter sp. HU-CL02332 TaxID=3127650 RepID=UPI003105B614